MNENRKLFPLTIALSVSLFIAGCSAGTHQNSPHSVGTSGSEIIASPSGDAPADLGGLFTADSAQSAAQLWRSHPDLVPPKVATAELLLDEKHEGPQTFDLPPLAASESLILVLTCNSEVAYELLVFDAMNDRRARTGGESCGGPNLNSYRTSAFTTAINQGTLRVAVPPDTEYYIAAYRSTI